MKVCEKCGVEIYTRDGENKCQACEDGKKPSRKRTGGLTRKDRDAIMASLGLVKVRGALGGTYYE
jgi:hypothetical protein